MRHYEINPIGGNRLGTQSPLIHTVSYIKRMGVIDSQTGTYIQGQVLAFAAQIWYERIKAKTVLLSAGCLSQSESFV